MIPNGWPDPNVAATHLAPKPAAWWNFAEVLGPPIAPAPRVALAPRPLDWSRVDVVVWP